MDAAVIGNATLDILCRTVDDVPRYDSIAFEQVIVALEAVDRTSQSVYKPAVCRPLLVACIGDDDAAQLARRATGRG